MSLDELGAAATAVAVIIAGAWNGWQTHKAKQEAKRAADNAHPVSNGWGSKITADLEWLRAQAGYTRAQIDRAHARMDEQARRHNTTDQRLAEATSYARTAAEQSSAATAGLAAHISEHDRYDNREVRL